MHSVAFYQGHKTGWHWKLSEKKDHIDILKLRAAKYAILSFTRLYPTAKAVSMKMDNVVALSYLMKMGGTQNQLLAEIWEDLLDKGIIEDYWRVPPRSPQQALCKMFPNTEFILVRIFLHSD